MMAFRTLVAVVGLCLFGQALYAAEQEKIQAKIIGGEASALYQWPWMVALVDRQRYDASCEQGLSAYRGQFCGGVLVGGEWVLTAAHCVTNEQGKAYSSASIEAVVGIHTLSRESLESADTHRELAANGIFVHPDYQVDSNHADIALLKLAAPVSNLPIRLPVARDGDLLVGGVMVTVTGWGYTVADRQDSGSDVLQQVDLPIYDHASCGLAYDTVIDAGMVCAGYAQGGKDSCQGDSGGPLQMKIDDEWTVMGLVSFGDGCAAAGKPGVNSNVAYYSRWINQVIKQFSSSKLVDPQEVEPTGCGYTGSAATPGASGAGSRGSGFEQSSSNNSGGGALGSVAVLLLLMLLFWRRQPS